MRRIFPDDWDGKQVDLFRAWVVWHVMEHDLHHGGELSLGMVSVLLVDELMPLAIAHKTPVLWHNPWAGKPLDPDLWQGPQMIPDMNASPQRMQFSDGSRQVLQGQSNCGV